MSWEHGRVSVPGHIVQTVIHVFSGCVLSITDIDFTVHVRMILRFGLMRELSHLLRPTLHECSVSH